MPKIKLGARPKSFDYTIRIPLPEGGEGTLPLTYRYRTRTEFGEFIDNLMDKAGVKKPTEVEQLGGSLRQAMEAVRDGAADYIMQIVDGWALDEEFNHTNVQQLCDELPAAATEIVERYRLACTEGRLGN